MVHKLQKLFGGLNLTWPRLIIFAVIAGLYTGLMAMLEIAKETSFADISISFEVWVLFGILIIMNSKSPLDSALKCFVFFLISQPLVYLLQDVIHHSRLFFTYYRNWVLWTVLTFPMGFVGWYMKKGKWWALLILAPMLAFVGIHYMGFLSSVIMDFPHHLLSAIFCMVTILVYPAAIFEDPKVRRLGLILAALILAVMTVITLTQKREFYNTILLVSSEDEDGVRFDDTYSAALTDASMGTVEIIYDENLEDYCLHAIFRKSGTTQLTLTAPDGTTYVYDLVVKQSTYDLEPVNQTGG